MPQRWSVGTQLTICLALVTASAGLWVSREAVSTAFASLSQSGERPGAGGRGSGRSGDRPLPVIVARVALGEDQQTVAAVGTARARRAVMLNAKSDGVIVAMHARAGDRVRAGDKILSIDSAKAELALSLAEKRLEDATRLLERSAYLTSRRVNSNAPKEDAESAVRKAQLEVAQYRELMRDLTVSAPFDGVVGISKFETGDRVTAGSEVMSLDDRNQLIVEFDVPEQFLPNLRLDGPVTATTPSYAARTFKGSIEAIDSRIDPVSRSVKVRAAIDNGEDALRPGMSFAISIRIPGEALPSVPQLALQWRGRESFIWIVEDGKVRRQDVRAVRRMTDTVLLGGGVEVGDLVVVEGVQRLRPGRAVAFELEPVATVSTDEADRAGATQQTRASGRN